MIAHPKRQRLAPVVLDELLGNVRHGQPQAAVRVGLLLHAKIREGMQQRVLICRSEQAFVQQALELAQKTKI